MNNIKLEKIESLGSCTHIKFIINDKDVGALYLKEEELQTLIKCLKNGIYSSDVEFTTNIFDEDDDFDLDDEDNND